MSSRTVLCQVIERLFQRSPDVRQAWIVVEWLERNAQDELGEFYEQVHYTASHGKGSSRLAVNVKIVTFENPVFKFCLK